MKKLNNNKKYLIWKTYYLLGWKNIKEKVGKEMIYLTFIMI